VAGSLYGGAWQKARAAYLAKHRLCVMCQARGVVRLALVVDHRVPHKGDRALFWDSENWQALCKACHDGVKQALDRGSGLRGASLDGSPLDPNHPWNRPS